MSGGGDLRKRDNRETDADVTLAPGDHSLTLQFADAACRSYGPEMSQTIKIHVK